MNDQTFVQQLDVVLENVLRARNQHRDPNTRYKRDWYDRMGPNYNREFFLKNAGPVLEKKSKLSREQREVVKFILKKTYEKLAELHEKPVLAGNKQ